MASDDGEAQKRKRDSPEEKPSIESASQTKPEEKSPPQKRQKSESDSSDSDCISQEDLLAQLGLNSVKKLKAEETLSKRVVHPEPPKQSILEFLKCPVISKKVEAAAHPPKERPLTNGYLDNEDYDNEDEENDVDEIDRKEKAIARLQNNLRNEEAKLLLLRKLYACQNDKAPANDAKSTPARLPVTTATTTQSQLSTAAAQRKPAQVAVTQKQIAQTNKVQSPGMQPRVVFLTQPRAGQPVIIAPKLVPVSTGKPLQDTSRNVRPLHVSVAQNTKTAGTKVVQRGQNVQPTAVYAQGSTAATVKNLVKVGTGDKLSSENGLKTTVVHSPVQPPQQTLAEAKLALRKQLERTLLQIPLPKPPVQDWNFVPSVNTQDFTILIGLEGVVNHIMESKEMGSATPTIKTEPVIKPPKFCSQCDTDFTSAWRKKLLEDDAKKVVMLCDMCCTQKIKKTLKADHTNRLKAAFVKAVKQEQEVEQKYQASGGGKGNADAGSKSVPRQSSHHVVPSLQNTRVVYHPSVHHSLQPQVFQPHHSIVHQLQQQQLQQQHQEIEGSGHHQETRYFTYVGQHNCQPQHKQRHNYAGDHDRQREYLLDMIPSGHGSRGYRI